MNTQPTKEKGKKKTRKRSAKRLTKGSNGHANRTGEFPEKLHWEENPNEAALTGEMPHEDTKPRDLYEPSNRDKDPYPHIPGPEQFGQGVDGVEFLKDEHLTELGNFIARDEAGWLKDLNVSYLWKAKGGQSGGNSVFAKCVKPTGLASYFSNKDIVIWLAADNLKMMRPTWLQIKALIYHEALHVEIDPETNNVSLRGHDFEGFRMEIERFGLWRDDLRRAAESMKNAQLDLFNAKESSSADPS